MHKDFSKIVNAINEVRNRLLNDSQIRALLVYDSSDALAQEEIPPIELAKSYISQYPVIEEGIITTDRNAAIAIDLISVDTDFEEGDSSIMGVMAVSVLCTDKVLLLDNNKFRNWEIARLITNDLDGMKGSASGKMVVTGTERFINKHFYGCTVKLLLTDDATEVEF